MRRYLSVLGGAGAKSATASAPACQQAAAVYAGGVQRRGSVAAAVARVVPLSSHPGLRRTAARASASPPSVSTTQQPR
eukprot:349999-Chlamydomonas_euryale.AAC.3